MHVRPGGLAMEDMQILVPVVPHFGRGTDMIMDGTGRVIGPLATKPPAAPPLIPPLWVENELHTTTTVRFIPLSRISRTNHRNLSADVGAYTYGLGHPMKPQRMRMTHELVSAYDMLDRMHVLVRCRSSDSMHPSH